MNSFAELAARLYPDAVPTDPAPAAAPTPPAGEELPEAIKSARDADTARRFYDDTAHFANTGLDKAIEAAGVQGDAAKAEVRAWSGVFVDVGLNADEAQTLATIATAEHTDEARSGWQGDALAQLKDRHGDTWQVALDDARRMVQRDPRLAAYLDRTGLGDHPRVVALAVEKARSLKGSGRLR